MAVTFSSITDGIGVTLDRFEAPIDAMIDKGDLGAAELIDLQKMTTEWTLAANTYSTILKTLGDALRGTLQKIN